MRSSRKIPPMKESAMNTWTVAAAKAKFSEFIELARSRGPQTITRNGRTAVVIVAAEEYKAATGIAFFICILLGLSRASRRKPAHTAA